MALNPNAQKWVEALRSGEYKQGVHRLTRSTPDGDVDCCLGVACKLAIADGVPVAVKEIPINDDDSTVSYDDERTILPSSVMCWLGLRNSGGTWGEAGSSLVLLNDWGHSFESIAQAIEDHAEDLFVPVEDA